MEKEEKKDNKTSKRGLVIVIIVLLLALLGAGLFCVNKDSDTGLQLIRNLNIAVSNDLQGSGKDKHPTMYDAVQACIKEGYITDQIVAVSGYNIAWESTTGHFVYVDMEKDMVKYPYGEDEVKEYSCADNRLDYFVVTKSNQYQNGEFTGKYALYSIYAYGSGWDNELIIHKGFDAGDVKVFTKIDYQDDNEQNVIIRTNTFATVLNLDAPNDTVRHHGYAAIINVIRIASSSLDEYGVVGRIENQEGHVEVMDGAEVFCLMENGENVEPTTINDGGIVHENMININAEEGIEKDSETGIANGHVDDCGPGRHTFSQYVIDTEHVYDVCTCCGYTLVHVKDTKGTVIKQTKNTLDEAGDVTGEDVVTPVELYATSEKIALDSNGEVNVDGLKKQNLTIGDEPIGEVDPNEDKPIQQECQHNWVYTPNNNGTHKVKCSKCSEYYYENCNTYGTDGACSICGNEDVYKVTLNKQNGEGGSDFVYARKGKAMFAITLPTKPGYTFDGYYSAINGGGTQYYNADGTSAKSYDLKADTTLYAKWNLATYNIIYYDMGGKEFSGEYSYYSHTLPTTYKYNRATTLVDPVSKLCNKASLTINLHQKIRAYYDFVGWYTDKECTNKITSLAAYTYTADIILYAKWAPKTYTIVYHDRSSMEHVNNSLSVALTGLPTTHTYGTKTTLPAPLEREGYAFLGWYTSINCGSYDDPNYGKITSLEALSDHVDYVEYHSSDSEPRRIHLYAKWAALHTITLKNGDTTIGIVYQPEGEPMVKLTASQIPTSTKTGYTFDGYYYTETGGGKKYYNSDGTGATNFIGYTHNPGGSHDPTFYARWKAIEYTITYNLNGGKHGANYPTTHTYDKATALVTPTKDGYIFKGWYTDSSFSGTALTSLSATGYTKNITLYAKWEKTSSWKPLNTDGYKYYPVLGGTNPQPDKFAYSTDGINFTEITKPVGGYTMSGDVAKYAAKGQLYYQGGSVVAVKFVIGMSSYEVAKAAKHADDNICFNEISSDKAIDVVFYEDDLSYPTINGIELSTIKNAYSSINNDMISNSIFCRASVDFNDFDIGSCDGDCGWLYVNGSGGYSRSSDSYYYIMHRTFN